MTGQHVRSSTDLLGQCSILTGHCPLTGRYFKPCHANLDKDLYDKISLSKVAFLQAFEFATKHFRINVA